MQVNDTTGHTSEASAIARARLITAVLLRRGGLIIHRVSQTFGELRADLWATTRSRDTMSGSMFVY